ncbi:MAG: DUF1501 domain-containing protein [Roseiflexaceae bacterium]|nr:DUF1501 domain-containing protein [Roseiflexaceae bacterium]
MNDTLIVIFQRGGADGLNIVVPHGDSAYYAARSRLAIAKPGSDAGALDLDGFFGLHPALAPLKEIWDAHSLAAIHACGSPDPTHSHFDAMDNMERGAPGEKSLTSGWLARHLAQGAPATPPPDGDPPFRAVGFGALLQGSLRGGSATALTNLESFTLQARPTDLPRIRAAHGQVYNGPGLLGAGGRQTLAAIDTIARITSGGKQRYQPADGARYPDTPFGKALMQIAQLTKADVGLEVACADIGDWDTHVNQGGAEGEMAANLSEFADGLHALYTDLADRLGRVTIVTMSEFGRRVAENGGGGTDHGHGNVMFALGGGVQGGKVYGQWPGLSAEQRYGPGDLAVTTDFRDVLGEILLKRRGAAALTEIFPGYNPANQLGLVKA